MIKIHIQVLSVKRDMQQVAEKVQKGLLLWKLMNCNDIQHWDLLLSG